MFQFPAFGHRLASRLVPRFLVPHSVDAKPELSQHQCRAATANADLSDFADLSDLRSQPVIRRSFAVLLAMAGAEPAGAANSAELPLPTDGATLCFADEGGTVTLSLEDGEYGTYFWLGAAFAARPGEAFAAGGTCRHDDGRFVCPIDGDGGWFALEAAPDGGVLVRPETGLRLDASDYAEDDPAAHASLAGEHTLAPAAADRCP
jgi:hypothetical protein